MNPTEPLAPYVVRRPSTVLRRAVRGWQYQVHVWGDLSTVCTHQPLLVLGHGFMDVGASFQFLVDALPPLPDGDRVIVAPDWRGFGGSSGPACDHYLFADYLGDLDVLLNQLSPDQPVDLLGHSMGGNIVMSYAGVRPTRIRRLVNLEGFGLPATAPAAAATHLVRWLDDLQTPKTLKPYASLAAVAERLQTNNPRLSAARAAWLAPHWAALGDDGQFHLRADPAHRRISALPYRADEVMASWRRISAPVMWVEGTDTPFEQWWGARYPRSEFEDRLAAVPHLQQHTLADCGHMVHHDQPERLAALLGAFLA